MEEKKFISKHLEQQLLKYIQCIIDDGITLTKPGSISYMLYGPTPSRQAISIKMGKIGEECVKTIIDNSNDLELLECGVQCIDNESGKKKDLDLLWKDERNKTIYYREAKGNIELDSEKLPATIKKVKKLLDTYIKPKYPEYNIDIGVFNWSIYNRKQLEKGISHIKKCEEKNIKVEHMEDMLKLLEFEWSQEDYNKFFRNVGITIDKMFNSNENNQ